MDGQRLAQRQAEFAKLLVIFRDSGREYRLDPAKATGQMALAHSFVLLVELAWKALAAEVETRGLTRPQSPRETIVRAREQGIIADADVWLEALEQRNLATHVYGQTIRDILDFSQTGFAAAVSDLARHWGIEE